MPHEDRKVLFEHFTETGLNSDVFNELVALDFELEGIAPGETFKSPAPRLYRGYFVERFPNDSELVEQIMKLSNNGNVEKFDAAVINIKNEMAKPATTESIAAIRSRRNDVYRLIYGRETNNL